MDLFLKLNVVEILHFDPLSIILKSPIFEFRRDYDIDCLIKKHQANLDCITKKTFKLRAGVYVSFRNNMFILQNLGFKLIIFVKLRINPD